MSSKKAPVKTAAKAPAKPAASGGAAGKPAGKGPAKKTAAPAAKGAPAKTGAAPAAAAPPKPKALPVEEIGLKELPVVLNDSKGLIKGSGRWALVIDESERVGVFLRHRDCNTINVLDSQEMQPERIRMALLGAIRYGKPMVVNLVENGSIDIVQDRFNEVMPDLWNLVLTKKILEDDLYMKLVKSTDDTDYTQSTIFAVGEGFTFLFLTANASVTEDTMGKVIAFKVV